jgi:hypothetical protein
LTVDNDGWRNPRGRLVWSDPLGERFPATGGRFKNSGGREAGMPKKKAVSICLQRPQFIRVGNETVVAPQPDERDRVTAVREMRRLFLIAASAHPDIRLEDSLHADVFEPAVAGGNFDHLVADWATSKNLNVDWLLHQAKFMYIGFEGATGANHTLSFASFRPEYQEVFQLPGWASIERDSVYQKRTLEMFRQFLSDSIKRRRRIRRSLISGRESLETHYKWAVERVCLKRKWASIAAAHSRPGINWQSVQEAASRILKSIELQ